MIRPLEYEINRLAYFYKLLKDNELTIDRLSKYTEGCINLELNNKNLDKLRIEHEYLSDVVKMLEGYND